MKVFAIVPVKTFDRAKTRLSSVLSPDDRMTLSLMMLQQTLSALAVRANLARIVVVSSDERARKLAESRDAIFLREENDSGVNSAVSLGNDYSTGQGADATIVIPEDIPLLDGEAISAFCALAENEERCVVICPSQRYDGTNLLLRKPPNVIRTFFDENSYESHISAARRNDVPVKEFATEQLMLDIDTPEDARQLLENKSIQKNDVVEFLKLKDLKRVA